MIRQQVLPERGASWRWNVIKVTIGWGMWSPLHGGSRGRNHFNREAEAGFVQRLTAACRALFIYRHCQEWSAATVFVVSWRPEYHTGAVWALSYTHCHTLRASALQSEHGETQIMKPERDVLSWWTIPVRRQANAPLFAVNCKAELPIKLNREKSHIFSLLTSIDFTYDPAELTIFSR